jgi:hypothetical protein
LRNNPDFYGINPILEPIVYEFNNIAKYWNPDGYIEYISSEKIMDYVKNNKRLLSNKIIKEYYEKILNNESEFLRKEVW